MQVAAMLTVFCQTMLKDGHRSPMFVYNANMVGSGKSLLAQIALIPVHGSADTHGFYTTEEMKKELDTHALEMTPYMFFDDQWGFVKSSHLNAFLTAKT